MKIKWLSTFSKATPQIAHINRVGQKKIYSCEDAKHKFILVLLFIIVLFSVRTTINLLLPHHAFKKLMSYLNEYYTYKHSVCYT